MTSHKTRSRWCYIVLVMVLAAAWSISLVADRGQAVDARPLTMTQRHAPAPGSLRLYVFDCGKLSISDPSLYGFTKDDLATTDMSVACFLVAHPKGTLMWDVGVLPDSVLESRGGAVTQGRATVFRSLEAQLAEVGYISADITYLAMSHYHWDHTANANDFAGSSVLQEHTVKEFNMN
jgi:N-acyl homoserine lactone hydrolase